MSDRTAIDFKNLHPFHDSKYLLSLSHKFPSLNLRFESLVKSGDAQVWFGDKETDPDVLFAMGSLGGSVSPFAEDAQKLENAMDRLVLKAEPRVATFSCTDMRFADLVIRKLREMGLKDTATGGEVFQMYSSKPNNPKLEGLKEGVTSLTLEDAHEIGHTARVSPLRLSDVNEVLKFWKYARNLNSATLYLQQAIKTLPSGGIRGENGELEAWAVTHLDCHLGALHTKEQFRNKGHARKIVAFIAEELWKIGMTPHVVVAVDNEPSKALFAKLGFVADGVENCWIHAK
eukprot:Phypoly_transcript_12945.p1 GENE.Phypoly_transcript_12945~~Phypoly_transcript_12945.p1  ORF type:complete len:288 (+),score=41.87 Phypoly_transcript_12945:90-953(+)